jgi:hypothetical protein
MVQQGLNSAGLSEVGTGMGLSGTATGGAQVAAGAGTSGGVASGGSFWSSLLGGGSGSNMWGGVISSAISGIGNSMSADAKHENTVEENKRQENVKIEENKRQEAYKVRNLNAAAIPSLNWSAFRPPRQARVAAPTANTRVQISDTGILSSEMK